MPLPLLPLVAGVAAVYALKRLASKKWEIPPPAPDASALQRLAGLQARPLPPELAVSTPRPDVWGERGYLAQPQYQERFKPLLTRGYATHALVYRYECDADPDGTDILACYAWLDARGQLQTRRLKEGYDAMHAGRRPKGQGEMVVDIDAGLGADKVLVLLHDPTTGDHIFYEALHASPRGG